MSTPSFSKRHVPSHQDPEPLIKSRLRDGAKHVTIGQVGNNLVYANSGGRGILGKLEQMNKEMDILIADNEKTAIQIDKHQKQIDKHQKQISSLESRTRHLEQSSKAHPST